MLTVMDETNQKYTDKKLLVKGYRILGIVLMALNIYFLFQGIRMVVRSVFN